MSFHMKNGTKKENTKMRIHCTQASLVLVDSVYVSDLNGSEVNSPHTLRITAVKKTFSKKLDGRLIKLLLKGI